MRKRKAYISIIVRIVGFLMFLFLHFFSNVRRLGQKRFFFLVSFCLVGGGGVTLCQGGYGVTLCQVGANIMQVTFSKQTANKHELVAKLTLLLLQHDIISHIQHLRNSYMKVPQGQFSFVT